MKSCAVHQHPNCCWCTGHDFKKIRNTDKENWYLHQNGDIAEKYASWNCKNIAKNSGNVDFRLDF